MLYRPRTIFRCFKRNLQDLVERVSHGLQRWLYFEDRTAPKLHDKPAVAAQAAAEATKSGTLITVAGGGDTVAALNQAGVAADFTYISTAGGAFLEWMEGKTLPGVAALSDA